ncbi:MAG: 4Fe-4S binding protein [Anaerolineae bacterium]
MPAGSAPGHDHLLSRPVACARQSTRTHYITKSDILGGGIVGIDAGQSWKSWSYGPYGGRTSLCIRDGSCVLVCPVDCIVPGLRTMRPGRSSTSTPIPASAVTERPRGRSGNPGRARPG